jgi:hypothetical protein
MFDRIKGVIRRPGRKTPRRILVAALYRIANDFASGYREGLTRARALTELSGVSSDSDLLSEAAAAHAIAEHWYAVIAVDLLIEAGADQELIQRHIHEHAADLDFESDGPGPEGHRLAS